MNEPASMANDGAAPAPVLIVPMRQLAEATCWDDNWTGLSDQAERRKRQTRLSLRAYRKRKAAQRDADTDACSGSALVPGTKNPIHATVHFIPAGVTRSGQFIPMRYLYPISRDHLLPLIEYNIWRGIMTNILITNQLHFLDSSNCRFMGSCPLFTTPYQSDNLPGSLKPTPLQLNTPHADWIDLFPSPRMRDNAIRTQHQFSNLDLCADVLSSLSGKQNDTDSGLRVWSNPWEPDGWELTEGFVRKWGFLVEGCTDLFRATNRWRELRGDEPMAVEDESDGF